MIKTMLSVMLIGLLPTSSFATDVPTSVDLAMDRDMEQTLFEAIEVICEPYGDDPIVQSYCQDAQYYGFQRMSGIASEAEKNEAINFIANECLGKFTIRDKYMDYAMSLRCISYNIRENDVKFTSE